MSDIIASSAFDPNLNLATLSKQTLLDVCFNTQHAYSNLFGLWSAALKDRFGDTVADQVARDVAPLSQGEDGLKSQLYEDLQLMAQVLKSAPQLLTYARYEEGLLPVCLDASLDLASLNNEALVLYWNILSLTYMMQTSRWYDCVSNRYDEGTAQSLEKEVWLDRGGAEDDLQIGLQAANVQGGSVEGLLKGFQMAPGEVGLVDVEFKLENPDHGWLIHRRCPAWDRFRNIDIARREHACVICVIGMRLSGEMVDSTIRCRPAELPPYSDERDYACQWEYWKEA